MAADRSGKKPTGASYAEPNGAAMDAVADLLGGGRTVAYKTELAHACGGATVGLLLSQFWYWTNNHVVRERGGWFWKTMEEITEETGLTRSEQESARKKLKQIGVLVEEFRDLPRKLYFRIDKSRLYEVLFAHAEGGTQVSGSTTPPSTDRMEPAINSAGNPHYGSGETRSIGRGKPAGSNAGNPQAVSVQKTTAKTTAENTTTDAAQLSLEAVSSDQQPPVAVVESKKEATDTNLAEQLVAAGVGKAVALRLAKELPDECRRQLGFLPFVTGVKNGTGAYLRTAIEQGYGPPPAWETAQKPKAKRAAFPVQPAPAGEGAVAVAEAAQRARLREIREAMRVADPDTWGQIVSQAERMLAPPVRSRPDSPAYKASIERHIDNILMSLQPRI